MAAITAACGGKAVVDAPLGDGGGASGAGSTTSSTTTSTTSITTTTTTTTSTGGIGGESPYDLVEIDLGTVQQNQPVTFTVTPQTVGLTTIVHSQSGDSGTIGVRSLRAPNQEWMINNFKIPGHHSEFWWYGTTVAGLPQSDSATVMPTVMPGDYELTVADFFNGGGNANVSVWLRESSDGTFKGGAINVNVFIAGDVTEESYMSSMLANAFNGYGGFNLGQVEFHSLGQQWVTIDEYNWLPVLKQTAAATMKPALNVIVIGYFSGELSQAAGIAAGIPGQGIEHGTQSSAVVMMANNSQFMDGIVVTHEGGHLMGLFHTSESYQLNLYDTLSDTPQCSNVDQQLNNCPDAGNLMFPYAMGGEQLTPLQQRVIHGSSIPRGELIPSVSANAQADDYQEPTGSDHEHLEMTDSGGHQPSITAADLEQADWAAGLPAGALHLLAGLRCGHDVLRGQPLRPDLLLAKLGVTSARLWAIGADDEVPAYVRYRALLAAAERDAASKQPPQQALLTSLSALARDGSSAPLARFGALRALDQLAPAQSRAIAPALDKASDVRMAHYARRIMQR